MDIFHSVFCILRFEFTWLSGSRFYKVFIIIKQLPVILTTKIGSQLKYASKRPTDECFSISDLVTPFSLYNELALCNDLNLLMMEKGSRNFILHYL